MRVIFRYLLERQFLLAYVISFLADCLILLFLYFTWGAFFFGAVSLMIFPVFGGMYAGADNPVPRKISEISKLGVFVRKMIIFFIIVYISFLLYSNINGIYNSDIYNWVGLSKVEMIYFISIGMYLMGLCNADRAE